MLFNCIILSILQVLFQFLTISSAFSQSDAAFICRKMVKKENVLHFNSINTDGIPISFPEYYISTDICCGIDEVSHNGNPILLLSKMSSCYKNWITNKEKVSLTIEMSSKMKHEKQINKKKHKIEGIIMGKPRANFFGSVKELELSKEDTEKLNKCFLKKHKDASIWVPGKPSSVQDSIYVEFNVEKIYFIGGFGDRSYIGDIAGSVYHNGKGKPNERQNNVYINEVNGDCFENEQILFDKNSKSYMQSFIDIIMFRY